MAVFETWLKSDLKKPMRVVELSGNLFSADNGGNLIGVEVMDGGQAASLTGSVHGYVIRADGATVLVDGTLTGNRASIVLPASAYLVIGQVSIVIKVGTVTVGACVAQVYRTTTDTLVDPANVIPSISELLEAIDDCEQATADANSAATLANTKAGLADEKATLADQKATLANTAAGTANTAAAAANAAATKIDGMTVAANGLNPGSSPTAVVSEVSGHKHITFGIPKGDAGKDFHIAKTFSSIAQMMAYTGTDIEAYDFAMIDTGSVQDPDTGKLYCYEPETQDRWRYIGDLSGAQGIKGETGTGIDHITLNADYTLTIYLDDNTSYTTASIRGATGETPDISIGTVTTLNHDQQAYVVLDSSSTPEDPVFNFGIPQGEPGSAENVYGTTVPMSTTDSTKVATAIGNKLDANQGSTNAGKFMRVGSTGAVAYDSPTERYSSLNDFPATGDEGKLYIAEDTGMMYVWDSEYVPVGGTSSDECEVSGDVVSFETFESKVKELVVNIEPVQDLHGYDSPWPGGGGKNLFNKDGTYEENKVIRSDGTIAASGSSDPQTLFTDPIYVLPSTDYVVSGTADSSKYIRVAEYSSNGTFIKRTLSSKQTSIEKSFTTDENTAYVLVNPDTPVTDIQLELGSTATDYAPYENVCPISGCTEANVTATGKNLFNDTIEQGTISATNGSKKNSSTRVRTANGTLLMPGTYTMSCAEALNGNIDYYKPDGTFIGVEFADVLHNYPITFTISEETLVFSIFGKTDNSNIVPADVSNVQIEKGSSASAYEAFGTTYTYAFPQSAGTVFNATLAINQDGSGMLTPKSVDVDMGDFDYDYDSTYKRFITHTVVDSRISIASRAIKCISSLYKCVYDGRPIAEVKNGDFYFASRRLVFHDNSFTDASAFKTARTGEKVVYPLDGLEPIPMTNQQVVSLLKGQNVLWADCGSIDLTYYRTETAYQVSLNTADIAELQGEVEELQNDFTGATASADGAHGLVPAPEEGDQGKFLKGDGTWGNVPNPQVMTGATSSTAGASGLVPAPAAGDQDKVLTGAGTWETPIGSRVYVVTLDAVTNTSGSYTHTTTVTGMTSDLKAVAIECSDPTIFHDAVTITTATDSVTLTCSDVAGSSTVKVSFLAVGNANPLSSTEYAALDARIGDLSDLTTTDKTSVVDAVNEVNNDLDKLQIRSDSTPTEITIPNPQANFTYTADEDCLLFVRGTSSSSAVLECGLGEINAVDNSVALYLVYNPTTTELQTTGLIPLKAGTKVSFVSSNWSKGKLNFIIKYT